MKAKTNLTMLCDFYELTMANGYFQTGLKDRICYFDVFYRSVPDNGGFSIAAGLAQVVERVWGRGRDRLPFVLRWGLTFLFVNIAWVFFRAPDCAGALELLGRAVTGGFAKPAAWLLEGLFAEETSAVQMLIPAFTPWKNILRVVLLYGAGMVAVLWPRNTIRRMEDFRPTLWRGAALTVLTLWCVLSFTGVTTFIYSNF